MDGWKDGERAVLSKFGATLKDSVWIGSDEKPCFFHCFAKLAHRRDHLGKFGGMCMAINSSWYTSSFFPTLHKIFAENV